jgi:hypothetical protein
VATKKPEYQPGTNAEIDAAYQEYHSTARLANEEYQRVIHEADVVRAERVNQASARVDVVLAKYGYSTD